jgi:hypothetical protein
MSVRRLVVFVVFALVSSTLPVGAQTILLLREDVAAEMSLQWKGQDGKRRFDREATSASLADGNSDFLQVCAQTTPSPVDNTEASYCSAYRRGGGGFELSANGAIVEDGPQTDLVHKNQHGFWAKFQVEGTGIRIGFYQHRLGGTGDVDFLLFDHTANHVVAQVVGNQTTGHLGSVDLFDGHRYSLIMRLSSKSGYGVEYGIDAYFDAEDGGVEIRPDSGGL